MKKRQFLFATKEDISRRSDASTAHLRVGVFRRKPNAISAALLKGAGFCLFWTDLFRLGSETGAVVLVSTFLGFLFWTVMFPAPPLVVFESLDLFALLGCLVVCLVSMLVLKV